MHFFMQPDHAIEQALTHGHDNLPISDPVLVNALFLDLSKREHADFTQIEYFVDRFSLQSPFTACFVAAI